MRTCEKCGKANQPTRKYCIRCGASMIKKTKPAAAPTPTPAPASAPTPAPAAQPPVAAPSDVEKAVKPSEVSRDRVRVAGGSRGKSELEKAREAFAKAETVGIDEAEGSGVIETRMLRASEVKELLEGPAVMAGTDVPPPTMMEGSEPLPPEAAAMMTPTMPTSSQIEQSILGAKSAYVDYVEQEPATTPAPPDPLVSAPIPEEFTSSKYEGVAETPPRVEEATTGFAPHTPPAAPAPAAAPDTTYEDDIDLVIACPDCGKTINVDMFEYPREVYASMGAARLKQARFFVVQGKGKDALRIIRMAYALYSKAGDDRGLDEVKKIIETLAKKP